MEQTCDPYVLIEERAEQRIRYVNITTGRRWDVLGTCNMCGACWEGAVGPAPTLDCPVTPEIKCCTELTFVELTKAK